MWIIPLVCQFCCTVSSITSNSRMLYAFSRDGAVPFSNLWHKISPHFQIPINAVWGMALAAVCIALPIVNSSEAFGAVTSIATIGLCVLGGGRQRRHRCLTLCTRVAHPPSLQVRVVHHPHRVPHDGGSRRL